MVDQQESAHASESISRSHLMLPLRAVAIASAVIALTSLVVLVVVASIKKVETLSTVALAVAIVTFVVQIIVFIVQGASTNSQMLQNQKLYGDLQSLLTSIGERAQGTHAAVTTMNERLLGAVLEKSSRGRGVARSDGQVVQEVARIMTDQRTQIGLPPFIPHQSKPDDAARLEVLRTFPEGENLERALNVLRDMPFDVQADLYTYGSDERRILEMGNDAMFNPGLANPVEGMLERGLVAEIPGSIQTTGRQLFALTDDGREVARLLTASEPIPLAIEDELRVIRGAIKPLDGPYAGPQ